MSNTGKTILWIVVILVVVGGGIWWWMASHGMGSINGAGTSPVTVNNANPSASSSLPQGDSNQAISQEMTDINAQMNGLSSDTASVNQSMNDQPVQQTNP